MNIERDLEVDREADAEVESRRGRLRIEVGLIASGNQEVIEDKISRVGRNGIILFDILGSRTRVYQTAENNGVK
ncbi:CfrBI family restriction endonuclease [candidate division KSB1 bacterium]|nr:CfrBI family restriction endonuclease [candidate division KSB1 bacterium]